MKRALRIAGTVAGALLLAAVGVYFWASSGALSDDALAQVKAYDAGAPNPAGDTLTVMTYNIGYLSGQTNNEPVVRPRSLFRENMEKALSLLRRADPDVVGLQEIDYGAARSFDVQQLDTLATRRGYPAAAQAVNWDERYLPFPYGRPAVHFGRVLSGQAVLSRFPVRGHERVELARTSRPYVTDRFYLDRLAQVVRLEVGGRAVAVINVHLEAFEEATREAQAEEVRALYRRLTAEGLPTLVIGDFNSVLPAARPALPAGERRAFAGDSTMATLLQGTGLRPALVDSTAGADSLRTYPADAPTRKIDHILYPPAALKRIGARVDCGAAPPPSDHCAVVARFRVRPAAAGGSKGFSPE
jgi:endonuclease/exonuclease/phosphatase family metal-dependent hydrolase